MTAGDSNADGGNKANPFEAGEEAAAAEATSDAREDFVKSSGVLSPFPIRGILDLWFLRDM